MSFFIAVCPISLAGCLILLNAGLSDVGIEILEKPITAISSGTLIPSSARIPSVLVVMTSVAPKIAFSLCSVFSVFCMALLICLSSIAVS
ncbi:hypothetical protein D3C87_1873160 [compost metagenome]